MSTANKPFDEAQLSGQFSAFCEQLFSKLKSGESARVSLAAEHTHFLRMSRGAVRQNGVVEDAQVLVQFMSAAGQVSETSLPFVVASNDSSAKLAAETIAQSRTLVAGIPVDPYLNRPSVGTKSSVSHKGRLLNPNEATEALLGRQIRGDDLVGIYASGATVSALADSAGMNHWFSSESFFVDYSLWLPNGRAVKSSYAGRAWDQDEFVQSLHRARADLDVLKRPQKVLKPGSYRVFMAPSATSELLNMFSWGALSEGALQRKDSPLCAVRAGEKFFSPRFSLKENFALGFAPRFSEDGELAPESISLIENGKFLQGLVGARTEKEFGVPSNGAGSERLRTPDMGTGMLAMADAYKALGTGLYLSDLHYLNWSDMIQGRVTGMTRYACVWVENGEAVAPIQDMRFDETLFRCFGTELLEVTREAEVIPETSTYGRRALGGARVPGMLLNQFEFTL